MNDETFQARLNLIDERLDHYRDRIETIEASLSEDEIVHFSQNSHKWEIIIGILVAVEAVFEILLFFRGH